MLSLSFSKIKKLGFTLVEMVVVVAIIVIMTGILLGNFPDFRDKVSLDLIAQEVAITIRQAQVFGSATRVSSESGVNEFPSYGVYFDPSENDNFVLFADLNNDNKYITGSGCQTAGNECREQFFLPRGVEIVSISSCDGTNCNPLSAGSALNVIFKRPFTDALFFTGKGVPLSFSSVKINIARPAKTCDQRSVVIWNTGHIYVEKQSSC